MTIRWTKLTFAACLSAGLMTTAAIAQGDPARAFDPATAAVRKPGTTVRIDLIGDSTQTDNAGYGRGFCANLSAQGRLREHGQRRRQHQDLSASRVSGTAHSPPGRTTW